MKKLLVLFAILAIGFITLEAQTVIKTDQVRTLAIDSILLTGESVNIDFYGKDFIENSKVQVQANAFTTGADAVMTVITKGSLDYATWTDIDTVSISGTSDNSSVGLLLTPYADYLRYVVAVAGTGDTIYVTLNMLFDVNE